MKVRHKIVMTTLPVVYFVSHCYDDFSVSISTLNGGCMSARNDLDELNQTKRSFVGEPLLSFVSLMLDRKDNIVQVDAMVSNVGDAVGY